MSAELTVRRGAPSRDYAMTTAGMHNRLTWIQYLRMACSGIEEKCVSPRMNGDRFCHSVVQYTADRRHIKHKVVKDEPIIGSILFFVFVLC